MAVIFPKCRKIENLAERKDMETKLKKITYQEPRKDMVGPPGFEPGISTVSKQSFSKSHFTGFSTLNDFKTLLTLEGEGHLLSFASSSCLHY